VLIARGRVRPQGMRKSTDPKKQNQSTTGKLPLRTNTLRKLTDDQLEQVAGGKCECCTLTCHGG